MPRRPRRALHIVRLLLICGIGRLRKAEGRARRKAQHHEQRADEMQAQRTLMEWDHENLPVEEKPDDR